LRKIFCAKASATELRSSSVEKAFDLSSVEKAFKNLAQKPPLLSY